MNKLLINKLKEARVNKGLKQHDVAEVLGIKPNTISNWEKGRTEPDIDTFVKLCNIYEIDCARLLSSVYNYETIPSDVSMAEYEHLKKYRALDLHSKRIVDNIIDDETKQDYFSNPHEAMNFLKSIEYLAAFNGKEKYTDEEILQLANTIKAGRKKVGM
ncbi:MAG: helix-turn-helix transcriptional regulator [Lachnospiraceae bacterium]|nr:helix-turn-helix transcriptional regulator [Lachnospiraceae bacterium]